MNYTTLILDAVSRSRRCVAREQHYAGKNSGGIDRPIRSTRRANRIGVTHSDSKWGADDEFRDFFVLPVGKTAFCVELP